MRQQRGEAGRCMGNGIARFDDDEHIGNARGSVKRSSAKSALKHNYRRWSSRPHDRGVSIIYSVELDERRRKSCVAERVPADTDTFSNCSDYGGMRTMHYPPLRYLVA